MTLQQLEYILALNQFRHFGKAAEHCGVTQPTLSALIQKLEEELDIRIFDRTRQSVSPTPAGRLILGQARQVLAEAARIKEMVAEERQTLTGTFTLGILPTIAPYLLPRFFPQLMKQHPQLDIRVTEMKTAAIKQALADEEIDAGIVAALNGMDDFAQTPLFYEQFYAYVAREDELFSRETIRTADLSSTQLWLLDEGHCFRDQLVRFCQLKSAQTSQMVYHLGSIHAHGGGRQGSHIHPRTGHIPVERDTARTGTPLRRAPPHAANRDAYVQRLHPPYAARHTPTSHPDRRTGRNAFAQAHAASHLNIERKSNKITVFRA